MIDRLIDVILQFGDAIKCWEVINHYEKGVRLRFGKYVGDVLEPGYHWKIPFADTILTIMIKMTTMRLPEQTVTTLDGKVVVVKAIIKYEITDPAQILLEVNDAIDAVADMAQGIVREKIIAANYDTCNTMDFSNEITKKTRAEAKKWGILVDVVTITDFGKMMSLRLLNTSTIMQT